MSVDSTALEQSALERKDRDELLTIAQALGGKPASRAKKADIVALILDLTGVSATDGSPSDTATSASTSESVAPVKKASRARKAAPAPESGGAADEPPAEWELETATDDDVVDGGADAVTGDRPDQARRAGGSAGGRGGQNGGQGRQGRQGQGQGGQGQGGQGHQSQGGQQEGDRPSQGGQNGAQARQGQNQGGQNQGQHQGGQGQSQNQGGQNRQGQGQAQGQGGPNQRGPQDGDQHDDDQGDDGDGEGGNRRRRRRGRNRERVGEGQGQGGPGGLEEYTGEPIDVEGFLDLRDEGYGFLRVQGYLPSRDDVYISVKQARQFGLRKGDHLRGASRPALRNEKNPALLRIDEVNGSDPEKARSRRRFEDLTPLFPDEKLVMEVEGDPTNVTARIIDLISPIGKGQRGLIVSPPKAGKTTIMKQIARSIETTNPEVHLFVLLVDERPEEVTDMKRWLKGERSTVVASTFDRPSEEHTHVAELTIERAKRLVEDGHDVVIILDGITRLARAYNLAAPTTGRVMSGGIDTGALYPPKKFFGAARNVEEGGSLTILATALVETGSRMDEVIFEEFKGTGNMELRLDRRLAERRIYPAIDVDASSTRHEELLFQGLQLQNVWKLRRVLSAMASEGGGASGLELLIDRMKSFKSNKEFLAEIGKAPGG
jgi:transcription termination factor Rho